MRRTKKSRMQDRTNPPQQVDFGEYEKLLPPFVSRKWPRWKDYIPICPRTMANLDSLGRGPSEKVMIAGTVSYPRAALLQWLKERSFVVK